MTGAASLHPALDRAGRLASELRERGVDALLVATPVNLRYLTGFTGSNGLALLGPQDPGAGGVSRFLTDFRYATQSAEQIPENFQREIVAGNLLEAAVAHARAAPAAGIRRGEPHRRARTPGCARELPPGSVSSCRAGGRSRGCAPSRTPASSPACAPPPLADEALRDPSGRRVRRSPHGASGRRSTFEHECAGAAPSSAELSLDQSPRALKHGAPPHAEPRDVEIPRGVLVTIDWGRSTRLLLGLHAHVCDRRGDLDGGA